MCTGKHRHAFLLHLDDDGPGYALLVGRVAEAPHGAERNAGRQIATAALAAAEQHGCKLQAVPLPGVRGSIWLKARRHQSIGRKNRCG